MANLTVTSPYAKGGGSIVRARFNGNLRIVPFTFVPASTYTTGGDSIATADMPNVGSGLVSTYAFPDVAGVTFSLDVPNKKLLAYIGGTGGAAVPGQVASTTNLTTILGSSAVTIFFLCLS